MSIDDWIDELDSKINHAVMDNCEWVKLEIDDLIQLTDCIKEYLNGDGGS